MNEVRQAHLPGNYELYDEASNVLGPVICKFCWEKEGAMNSSSLETVWLSSEGRQSVLWLCKNHRDEISAGGTWRVLRTEDRVVSSPPLERML